MKPATELLADTSNDSRHTGSGAPTAPMGPPRVSGTMVKAQKEPLGPEDQEDQEDHLPALVQAIDDAFRAGLRVDLVENPLAALSLFEATNDRGEALVTVHHWAAYARQAGLDFTPSARLRARVIAFYGNWRREG